MRVLHVISDTNIGGAGVLLCTLLRHFDRSRVQSTVALPKGSALRERIEAIGIPTHSLKQPCDGFSLRSVREISSLLREDAFDILHANAALSARIAGRREGVAVLHTRHCCFPPSAIWHFSPVRRLGGWYNGRLSDRIIATAEAARENLLAMGVPDAQIEVIINGSEPVREVASAELDFYRQAWELPNDAFAIGICARLVSCKGHETFLEAARLALAQLPHRKFFFLIAGEGERRAALEAMAGQLGISESVRFLGFVSDLAPFYRLLRINVNCSNGTETSCLALSEGMSVGAPTVASDYGGNRAMLGDGQAGILYPIGDAKALADAICSIAEDREMEVSLRRAAYERYRSHYTAEGMTERVTALYESVLRS